MQAFQSFLPFSPFPSFFSSSPDPSPYFFPLSLFSLLSFPSLPSPSSISFPPSPAFPSLSPSPASLALFSLYLRAGSLHSLCCPVTATGAFPLLAPEAIVGPSGAEGPTLLLVEEGWESTGCDSCEREEDTLLDLLCVECCEPSRVKGGVCVHVGGGNVCVRGW